MRRAGQPRRRRVAAGAVLVAAVSALLFLPSARALPGDTEPAGGQGLADGSCKMDPVLRGATPGGTTSSTSSTSSTLASSTSTTSTTLDRTSVKDMKYNYNSSGSGNYRVAVSAGGDVFIAEITRVRGPRGIVPGSEIPGSVESAKGRILQLGVDPAGSTLYAVQSVENPDPRSTAKDALPFELHRISVKDNSNEVIARLPPNVSAIAVDENDNVYVSADGAVTLYNRYGKRTAGFPVSADGIAVDPAGTTLYISNRTGVFQIDLATRSRTLIVDADPKSGPSGDGGPARNARLAKPGSLAIDVKGGQLYIADQTPTRGTQVRQVDLKSKLIATVAGPGGPGAAGKLAFSAGLQLGVDDHGQLYVGDLDNCRVLQIEKPAALAEVKPPSGIVPGPPAANDNIQGGSRVSDSGPTPNGAATGNGSGQGATTGDGGAAGNGSPSDGGVGAGSPTDGGAGASGSPTDGGVGASGPGQSSFDFFGPGNAGAFGQVGATPYGQVGANPFGQVGATPFGQGAFAPVPPAGAAPIVGPDPLGPVTALSPPGPPPAPAPAPGPGGPPPPPGAHPAGNVGIVAGDAAAGVKGVPRYAMVREDESPGAMAAAATLGGGALLLAAFLCAMPAATSSARPRARPRRRGAY